MALLGIGDKLLILGFILFILNRFLGLHVAIAGVIAILASQLYKWYKASTFWASRGVPSPPAWPLLGHMIEFNRKGMHNCDKEWMEKYGKMYGSYLFTQPEIVITEEEILKRVLVKDFHNFTNRRVFDMSKKSLFSRMVSALKDDDWKNTRNAITPAFTSGKLKSTVHLMENCVNTLCSILDEQQNNPDGVDVRRVMGNMTMDVIGAAAFAMDVDAQRNPDCEFTKHARELGNITFKDWKIWLAVFFPFLLKTLHETFGIQLFFGGMEEFYIENLSKVINERRQNPQMEKPDFLQLLINAADEVKQGKYDDHEVDTSIDHGITANKKWALTDRDIIAQSFLFLFAGHETTATTLTFACYLLALHPEYQEKCYQEIKALVENDEPITYANIQHGMPYLEAVMNETLRMFPPAVRFDRQCQSDYQLTDQLTIPKDSIIVVPVYAIQHSAENYEDPEKFDPERFLKKNPNPFAFLPFGYGPRNCIGMRFAQLEFKLALGNVIRKFKIVPCAKTEQMPIQLATTNLLKPKTPIRLSFKRRDE